MFSIRKMFLNYLLKAMNDYTLLIPGLGSTRTAIESIREMLREKCTGLIEVFDYDSRGAWDVSNFLLNRLVTSVKTERFSRLMTKLSEVINMSLGLRVHIIAHSHGALLLYKALVALSIAAKKPLDMQNFTVDAYGPAKLIPAFCKYFALQSATNHFQRNDWILRLHGSLRVRDRTEFDHVSSDGTVFRIKITKDPRYVTGRDAHQSYYDESIWNAMGTCRL